MALILSSGKRDFIIDPPKTNVAGTLGFSDETKDHVDLASLGAFITNPISLNPRTVARPPRVLPFPGGFLLHTGHPNPGLQSVIQQHQRRWRDLPCPVIIHILGQSPTDTAEMVERLEELEAIAAIELGLEATDSDTVSELTAAAVTSELPIIAQVPMDCSEEMVLAIVDAGAHALSLGSLRGSLPSSGEIVSGRLYGPALFPLALKTVAKLSILIELPIFASGGIFTPDQINSLLDVGAQAVQLDSVLWTEPERVLSRTGFPTNTDDNQETNS
jgi:dihydroorotate dehydrogenase (NAD+) catalytic subunit